MLSPIEIKKSASPGKNAIKNFKVLEPVTKESAFGNLESLKVEIGNGSVVCMANDLLSVEQWSAITRGSAVKLSVMDDFTALPFFHKFFIKSA